jgi:5-formyltetrahydrofolate cyclo-ligase
MAVIDLPTEKRRLRGLMRARLAGVSPAGANAAGAEVAIRITRTGCWRQALRIALFISRSDEIDTGPLIRAALRGGKQVLLPRMTPSGTLDFASTLDPDGLRPGRLGIPEPPGDAPRIALDGGTVLLAPGLAFDRRGGRLGRGGGYYDRSLGDFERSGEGPLLIGVGFSFQLVERVPMEPHDVRLDGVVDESGLVVADVGRTWRGSKVD